MAGIPSGALTIVSFWPHFITLADWMHTIAGGLSGLMHGFWRVLGSLAGLDVPLGLSNTLSFLLFYGSLIIGTTLMTGGGQGLALRLKAQEFNSILLFVSATAIFVAFYYFSNYEAGCMVFREIAVLIIYVTFLLTDADRIEVLPTAILAAVYFLISSG